jgi:hypothetical protein
MFEDYYQPQFDADYFNSPAFQRAIASAVEQYSPAPVEPVYYAPEPVYYAPEPVSGIGRGGEYDYYQPGIGYIPEEVYAPEPVYTPEPIRTPAVEPMTVEAEPIMGIGSPFVAETAAAPSLIETAAAAPAADTGLQVINANTYSPSDTDLQTMQMSRDQWNEMMDSFATMDLGNLNFGNFGATNPEATNNFRTFTAPKSNKGNPTSTVAKKDNTFNVIENQPIRLVDMRTKKVVFQGNGYEAAQKAIELAAGLTKEGGNKADWEIQTGQFKNPGSGDLAFGDTFKTVANEKRNKSFLNQALDIVGDAALGFIIGGPVGAAIAAGASAAGVNVSDIAYPIIATAVLGPVGPAATAGAAALGSAVSSAVQGRSIEETLIRAGVAGATAGVMSGTEVGADVSKAVSDTLKSVGLESQTGNIAREVGNLINGTVDNATGDIVVTAAKKAAEEALKATTTSGIGGAVSSVVSKAVVDSVQKTITEEAAKANEIVVTANPVTTVLTGSNPIVETASGIAGGFSGVGDLVDSPELRDRIAEEKARVEEPKEEIVVTATPEPEVIPVPVPETAGIGGIVPVEVPPSAVADEPIVVEATRPVEPTPAEPTPEVSGIGGPIPSFDPNAPIVVEATRPVEPPPEEPVPEVSGIGGAIEPIVVTAPKVVKPPPETVVREEPLPVESVLAGLPLTGLPTPDPALTEEKSTLDKIKDAVNIARAGAAVIPLIAGGGGGGDDGPLVPSGGRYDVNPNRSDIFGTRRPATIGFNPFTYGQATGDQPGEYLFFTRDPVTGAPTIPAPITTPTANEPAGPAMILPSDNTFAEGGEVDDDMAAHLMAYHKNGGHTGPGQVKGIGSGQEDKIPAWLSDGEYVWSAQDVADLGDGSTDEGVRRLDKMRHMVRRRAGRKDVKKIAKPQKGIDHMLKAVGGSV